ncbi:MAG: PKD domain-containing protein [Deltaproteobacteria bacterium]
MFLSGRVCNAVIIILIAFSFNFISPYFLNAAELILSWKDNSNNEDGFDIERSLSENGPFQRIARLGPNSTSYNDSSISRNIEYCYRVTAFNAYGGSSGAAVCAIHPRTGGDSNTIFVGQEEILIFDDFEGYGTGKDPASWKDTRRNNSFVEDPGLFTTKALGNEIAFGTESRDTNIHSHYAGEDALNWTNYTYTGRMYITNRGGGIGVTFFSRYPEKRDIYYRLRRYAQRPEFHISAHGTSVKGDTDSGVKPFANRWYRFRIEVEDTVTRTSIRAKVWREGEKEPDRFQIEAYDDSVTRINSGTIGVWTMGRGTKLFDDLAVSSVDTGVQARPLNNPPVAAFDMDPPESAVVGERVFFDAGGSFDPDGEPLSYAWDFGDGFTETGETVNHTYSDPGTYDVTLTVSDAGLSDSITSQIAVDLTVNSVPVAVIRVDPGSSTLPGRTLFFDAGGSFDPDGHPLNYTWDFGDGSTATGSGVSHGFSEPGMYEVLLVVDDGQLSDTEIIEIVVDAKSHSLLFSEDFEEYEGEGDPENWMDTGSRNSFNEDASLFKTKKVRDTVAFGTSSGSRNIHSHYTGEDATEWTNYIYTGRMFITNKKAGAGVTFFSRYPEGSDAYYRLGSYGRRPQLHLASRGTRIKGDTDSGVLLEVNNWYEFRIEVEDTGTETNIRGKVWKEGEREPEEFQIDAYDDSRSRITSGAVGVWSTGKGTKLFDNLEVRPRL